MLRRIQKIGGVVFLILLLGILAFMSLFMSLYNNKHVVESNKLLVRAYDVVQNCTQIKAVIKEAEASQKSFLLMNNASYLAPFNTAKVSVNKHLNDIRKLTVDNDKQQLHLKDLQSKIKEKFADLSEAIETVNAKSLQTALAIENMNQSKTLASKIDLLLNQIIDEEHELLQENAKKIEMANLFSNVFLLLTVLFILVAMILAVYLTNMRNRARTALFLDLENSHRTYLVNSGKKSNIEDQHTVIELLISDLKNSIDYIRNIGSGNYKIEFPGVTEQNKNLNKDNLAGELISVKEKMEEIARSELDIQDVEYRRNWTTNGLAKFGDILRKTSGDLSSLADEVIKNLVKFLNANQGGLFIYNDNDKNDTYLELIATYAFERKRVVKKRIAFGTGLVGMVAFEKATVYMTEIPEGYIKVTSGLGDATPTSLLLVPLKHEGEVMGVVELASFNELKDFEIKFVETLGASIAATLATARVNARTEQLLYESRRKSEELQSQEEEMRQNLEEMRATQERAIQHEQHMQHLIDTIDSSLIRAEFELNGNISFVNEPFEQTVATSAEELMGLNINHFVETDRIAEFQTVWADTLKGKLRSFKSKIKTLANKDLWLQLTLAPIKNNDDEVEKIVLLATNITKQKEEQHKLRYELKLLQTKEKEYKQELEDVQRVHRVSLQKMEAYQEEAVLANQEKEYAQIQAEELKTKLAEKKSMTGLELQDEEFLQANLSNYRKWLRSI